MKKSFILHERTTGEEILIASSTFCYATARMGIVTVCIGDGNITFEVTESIKVIHSLYEETEG